MADIDKVIKGLQCCSVKGMNTCELQECPYYSERYDEWNRCTNHLATDVLALLKEQEAETEWCERCGRVRLKSSRIEKGR